MSAFRQMRARMPAGSPGGRTPPAPPPLPPAAKAARIGKYEIEAEIGQGALVRVFRGFDPDAGRPVRLKVVAAVADRDFGERFRREVRLAAQIRHPSLIAIYELGEDGGRPFAAMQYLGVDHLARAIETQRPLTLLQKMLILEQVAEGLETAHHGGLAHVGIRPGGIALVADGSAVIQDFGAVRLTPADRAEESPYASPEELAPEFQPDSLCDVFAFGAVAFELLTGKRPFPAAGQPPQALRGLAPECPEALERLVARALDPCREGRYQGFEDIRYDAEPILRDLKRAGAAALLAEARRLVDAQDLDQAQNAVREALDLDPVNRKAHRLRAVLRGLHQRRLMRSRLEALWREADEAAAAHRFDQAVENLRAAALLDSASQEARSRLEQMSARLEQSRRAAQLIAEARTLLDQRALPEAREKASEALALQPQSAEAAEALQEIGKAIERRDKQARVDLELAKARSLLAQKSFDAAIQILTDLRAESPDSLFIEHRLAEAQAQKAVAERQARLEGSLGEARSLLAGQQFAGAVAILEAASAEFSDEAPVRNLLRQAREAAERADAIARSRAQADQHLREHRFDQALEVLDAALARYSGEQGLMDLRREVEEQGQAFQRVSALRRVLQEVEWLLEQDRPDLALQVLRDKSADFSDQPEFRSRLAATEAMLPGWEKHRFVQETLRQVAALEQRQQGAVALIVVEEALDTCPASWELFEAAGRLREQERRRKLARRLEMIGHKITAQAWPEALALIEAAQAEFPDEPGPRKLREEVEAEARRSAAESIRTEVRQLLAGGEADRAEDVLRKGLELLPEEAVLAQLREELEANRRYEEDWRAARFLFGRRRFREAEEILVRLAADRPEAQALLATVREARAASEEEDFYRSGREKARKLMEEQQRGQAADLLRNLLSLFPDDPILRRDLQAAQGDAAPDRRESPAAAPEEIGSAEPESPPAPPVEALFQSAAPPRARWALIAIAVLLLLVSASAAVWKLARGESRSPAAHPSAAPRPVTGKVSGLKVLTSEAGAS